MDPAMDPSEYPGTPEYNELQADREARYTKYLDLIACLLYTSDAADE